MRFYLPNDSRGSVGGGWTFRNNFQKYGNVGNLDNSDIALISGITMLDKRTYYAVREKLPYILRIDGIPEPWRNPRVNVFKRLKDWAHGATGIVFQSEFTKKTVGKLLDPHPNTAVIYNGIDTELFHTNRPQILENRANNWLYVHHRQDPNKRPEEVLHFARYYMANTDTLVWVGSAPDKWDDYNLGIPENIKLHRVKGTQTPEELSKYMASCKFVLFPSFADPCPNTLIEALSCGCIPLLLTAESSTREIAELNEQKYDFTAERMVSDYVRFARKILRT